MATVTGLTKERMQEIIDATIVDATVVGDNLILTKDDGSTIDAGDVRGPAGANGAGVSKVTAFPAATDGDIVVRTDQTGDPAYKYSDGVWLPLAGESISHVCRLARGSNTGSLAPASIIPWDVEASDVSNMHGPADSGRIVAPQDGRYFVSATVLIQNAAAGAGGYRGIVIERRTAANNIVEERGVQVPPALAAKTRLTVSIRINLLATEYVQVRLDHDGTGGASGGLTVDYVSNADKSIFEVERMGPLVGFSV